MSAFGGKLGGAGVAAFAHHLGDELGLVVGERHGLETLGQLQRVEGGGHRESACTSLVITHPITTQDAEFVTHRHRTVKYRRLPPRCVIPVYG